MTIEDAFGTHVILCTCMYIAVFTRFGNVSSIAITLEILMPENFNE